MEYERIHKVQSGLLSPSKLRMKLIGSHHNQKKKDASNSNSSRTSPSKLEDLEIVKNSLLDAQNGDVDDQVLDGSSKMQPKDCMPRGNGDSKVLLSLRIDNVNTADSLHLGRSFDDENLDYDSTSSFEFHKERSNPHHAGRSFTRPMPSKWNDAEKWIMNRQIVHHASKKMNFHNQSHRVSIDTAMVVPEGANNNENKLAVKRVDFCMPPAQPVSENKSDLVSDESDLTSVHSNGVNALIDSCPESKDLTEVNSLNSSCTKSSTENTSGIPAIRSVSMRDMGTEMTPIPSQEPSRTATPEGATTPLRSPTSSTPSTPRRAEPSPTPTDFYNHASLCSTENGKREMSDQEELKLKIRREIVALGVQLGKMNIAAWASKDEKKDKASADETRDLEELQEIEFAKRAAVWEEAEKSEHNARFKRKELEIQAWENHQKRKLEAEMRKAEAQVEQIRMQAQAKMAKKMAKARQKSEEKRVAAEVSKNRHAKKVAAQAEHIRQRGRLPSSSSSSSSSSLICCGWS